MSQSQIHKYKYKDTNTNTNTNTKTQIQIQMYVSSSRPSGGLTDDITSTAILHNSDECPHPHTRSYPTCHNLKYTNTNTKTLLQIQLYKYKHTSTNAHMKIHDSDECPPRLPSAPTRCRLVIISKVKSFSFFLCSDGSLCWRKTNKETKVASSHLASHCFFSPSFIVE